MSEPPFAYYPDWTYTIFVLLTHPREPRVLLLPDGDCWSLPHFESGEHDLRTVGHIQRMVRRLVDIAAIVLGLVDVQIDTDTNDVLAIFALESLDADDQYPRGRYLRYEDLRAISLAQPTQQAVIETYLAGLVADTGDAVGPDWARRGWYATAATWIAEQLAGHGRGSALRLEQVRAWELSCTLRAATASGSVYFKAVHQLDVHELPITQTLATMVPASVPMPLICDVGRGWMLLGDVGVLMDYTDSTQWEQAISLAAHIQIASSAMVDRFLVLGCEDLRLGVLEERIKTFAHDERILGLLEEAERATLQAYVPRLAAACRQLAAYGIPETLLHGDLHTGNIAVKNGRLAIFDWGEACVSHPFLDVTTFLNDPYFPEDRPELRERLRELYVQQWGAYGSQSRLRPALALADVLGHALPICGFQRIFPHLHATWEKQFSNEYAQYWLRMLLRHADTG